MSRADVIQNKLHSASPLEVSKTLLELELYDQKEAQTVIDEVYKKFETGGHLVDSVLVPATYSVVDAFATKSSYGKWLGNKGLTPSRIVEECKSFSYEQSENNVTEADSRYQDEMEIERNNETLGMPEYSDKTRAKYYDNVTKRKNHKKAFFAKRARRRDEYQKTIVEKENSDVDHIIPVHRVYEELKGNAALNSEDIREISNIDGNYAVTDSSLNRSKGEKLNEEMTDVKGKPLKESTKDRMVKKSEEARKKVDEATDKAVLNTLIGKGNVKVDKDKVKADQAKFEKDHGRKMTAQEKKELKEKHLKTMQKEKRNASYGALGKGAVNQSKDQAVGGLILYIIKPIYYEMKDILLNGLEKGVNISGKTAAIKFRFNRVKTYVIENSRNFAGTSMTDFIKGIVSSFISGIINCFVGMYLKILKAIKEGIKIFYRAAKVLWGKDGEQMSSREKGDAILKLIGAGVAALAGIALENVIDKLPVPEWAKTTLTALVAGALSALFVYLLDKMDLFSVKSEKRRMAIEAIFEQRRKEIEAATIAMDSMAIHVLEKQQEAFQKLTSDIKEDIDAETLKEKVISLADFFKIDLPYTSVESFVTGYDKCRELRLD